MSFVPEMTHTSMTTFLRLVFTGKPWASYGNKVLQEAAEQTRESKRGQKYTAA